MQNTTIEYNYAHDLNCALRNIGLNVLEQYFDLIIKTFPELSDSIVSIGSGTGYVEKHIENKFDIKIHCVDPINIQSTDDLHKSSEYKCVEDLLQLHPELKSNSITFINWSFPNESIYDYEALIALDSPHVLIVFESTGSGGGEVLQQWLRYCGVMTDCKPTLEELELHKFPKYHEVCSTVNHVESSCFGFLEYQIIWMSKNVVDVDRSNIPSIVGNPIVRREFGVFNFSGILRQLRNTPKQIIGTEHIDGTFL